MCGGYYREGRRQLCKEGVWIGGAVLSAASAGPGLGYTYVVLSSVQIVDKGDLLLRLWLAAAVYELVSMLA